MQSSIVYKKNKRGYKLKLGLANGKGMAI